MAPVFLVMFGAGLDDKIETESFFLRGGAGTYVNVETFIYPRFLKMAYWLSS
jgi:hypothetical protein